MNEEETPMEETVAEEVPVDEAYIPTISVANREFIRNNYKKLDMPQLCMATGVSPDLVAMYIEAYEDYIQKNNGSQNERANFTMTVDENGNIGFGMQWPTIEKTEKILPYLGKAMYLLHSGKLKENTVQFFINMGEDKGNYKTIKAIVNGWKEEEKAHEQAPLVSPHEVLGG
jgi:hypothetical protein